MHSLDWREKKDGQKVCAKGKVSPMKRQNCELFDLRTTQRHANGGHTCLWAVWLVGETVVGCLVVYRREGGGWVGEGVGAAD